MNIIRRTRDVGLAIDEAPRRLHEFKRTREAIPLHEVKAWVESWGTDREIPRPKPALRG